MRYRIHVGRAGCSDIDIKNDVSAISVNSPFAAASLRLSTISSSPFISPFNATQSPYLIVNAAYACAKHAYQLPLNCFQSSPSPNSNSRLGLDSLPQPPDCGSDGRGSGSSKRVCSSSVNLFAWLALPDSDSCPLDGVLRQSKRASANAS